MAWGTPTQPVAQVATALNPTTAVSASFTPTANSVLIASVMMGTGNTNAVFSGFSGHGTWSTTVTSAKYGANYVEIVIGVLRVGASPTADTVTATFSSAPARAILAIQQITTDVGVDENIVVRSASSGTADEVSSLTGDFAAAPSASSMLVAFAVNADGSPRTIPAATGWTSLGAINNGFINGSSQYRTGTTSTTYGTGTFTGGDALASEGVAIAAVELQEAATETAPVITTGTITNATAEGFQVQFTTDTANGTAYYVVEPTGGPDPTALQISNGQNDEGNAALRAGNMTIGADGVQTFSAVTGLDPNTTYRVSVVHLGNPV